MTEQEELEKLKERKKKIELKYAKKAKRRLTEVNKIVSPKRLILDMNDREFKAFLQTLQQEIVFVNNARNHQQQR